MEFGNGNEIGLIDSIAMIIGYFFIGTIALAVVLVVVYEFFTNIKSWFTKD